MEDNPQRQCQQVQADGEYHAYPHHEVNYGAELLGDLPVFKYRGAEQDRYGKWPAQKRADQQSKCGSGNLGL